MSVSYRFTGLSRGAILDTAESFGCMTREEKAQYCIDNQKKSPAFQFYPDNWWGSRHVAAMNVEQRGIHANLLFSAWLEPTCGIPENEICLTARIPEDKINDAKIVLSWCWFLYAGFWFSERLLNERIKQVALTNIRTTVGSLGGRPIKSKINRNKPIANQKDSKHKAKITKSVVEEEDEIEDVIVFEVPLNLKEVWPTFIEVRKKKGAVNSPLALKMILTALNKLSNDPAVQVKIIEQSIRSSWKDVYQIKEQQNVRQSNRDRNLTGAHRGNNGRPGYDETGNAIGAVARPGEFDEGIITLEGVRDH